MRLEIEPVVNADHLSEADDSAATSSEVMNVAETLKIAIEAAQNGDRNDARVLLFKVTDADPTNVDAWLWLASISEYPEELLGFLVRVLEFDPRNERARQWERATRSLLAKTFVQRGVQANADGQREFAAECFDQALEYDLSCESAWFNKAQVSDTVEEKELCLARVLDINPSNRDALLASDEISTNRSAEKLNAARVAAFADDVPAAVNMVDAILTADPDCVAGWKLRSQLAVSFADKLEAYAKILQLDPADLLARAGHDYLAAEQALAEAATAEPPVANAKSLDMVTEAAYEVDVPAPEAFDTLETNTDLDAVGPEFTDEEPEDDEWFARETDYSSDVWPDTDEELEEPEVEEPSAFYADEEVSTTNVVPCAFCGGDNQPEAFTCVSCRAALSISDIETLLGGSDADVDTVQDAVTRMEAEWNMREFDESELTTLGLGHFNLQNFEQGLAYFKEASCLSPNNVILSGQINALAIRLDEMKRQRENSQSLPRGKTILVVDDSATVRKLIASKLEKSGHNVLCAIDGVDAMEMIETTIPDLVLLDIAMPRMDGYSVCKLIRANDALKDVPVVMISGKDGFFDKVRGRIAGATGYITKPFGPETLMRALEMYLVPEMVEADEVELVA